MPMKKPKERKPRTWPDTAGGVGLFVACALLLALIYGQFRGDFTPKTQLTMLAAACRFGDGPGLEGHLQRREHRSGGRHLRGSSIDGKPAAKFTLDVDPKYVDLIPVNVIAKIQATTVFGNKYVSLTSPKEPSPQRITSAK